MFGYTHPNQEEEMLTRKQYLDGECTHREYYGQFVTDRIKQTVARHIGLDKLKESTDEHFNDIPLQRWDCCLIPGTVAGWLRKAGDVGGESLADRVCVAKEAGRQLID